MLQAGAHKTISRKIAYHLKVAVGAIFISAIFSWVLFHRIFHGGLVNMLLLTFLQLELFLWLGHRFFRSIHPETTGFVKKTILRLILFYLSVLLIAFTLFLALYLFYFIRSRADFSEFIPGLFYLELKTFLMATLIGFALGALFFFYTQWTDAVKSMQKLREEKLIFQYETLKSQVNPHFLFNSLNTLSSLIGKDASLSERFIQRLSSVYRYVLENQEKDLVPVSSELSFVRDYFALQQVRDQEKIELKIEHNGSENAMIIPVSLQMLVENALKHNLASRKAPLLITIHFEGLDKLTVRNNLQPRNQLDAGSKIGLKNLNERCILILGREIEVHKTMEEFVVKVPVKTILSCM